LALAALTAVALTGLTGLTPAAANAPGSPGTPAAPVAVFTEDFENGQGAQPTLLTDYTGAGPVHQTYTADPAWLRNCNGYLTSLDAPTTEPAGAGCGSGAWSIVKNLASALGTWSGAADPAANHAVTAYTQADPGGGKVQLQTAEPIPLPAANRFLTFSVDVAATSCYTNAPQLSFYLLDGQTALPTSTAPINACANPGSVVGGVSVGTYASNGSVLFSGTSAGIRLINDQASGNGNDGAFDNVRLLDATPQLDLGFSPATRPVGAPATLTFTLTNTSELAAKNGWSFNTALPSGLRLTDDATTTTCGNGSLTAGAGNSVAVSGDLAAGQASCTVTAHVTSTDPGTYQLCAAAVTDRVGIDPPGCASVTFTAPVFDARSNAARVYSPLLPLGPIAPSAHSCTTAPGSDSHGLVSTGLGTLGSLGVISTDASGTVGLDGTRTAAAHASIAHLSLLGGLISADAVDTSAQARTVLTSSGPGPVSLQGTSTLTGLRVAGVAVGANPPPNTTIGLPLVGSVVLNEQTAIGGGKGITVNALHVTLLTGVQLTLGTATAALLSSTDTCPAV
jgi:hypothetical protein